jgi:hypothetical protein
VSVFRLGPSELRGPHRGDNGTRTCRRRGSPIAAAALWRIKDGGFLTFPRQLLEAVRYSCVHTWIVRRAGREAPSGRPHLR